MRRLEKHITKDEIADYILDSFGNELDERRFFLHCECCEKCAGQLAACDYDLAVVIPEYLSRPEIQAKWEAFRKELFASIKENFHK